MSFRSSGKRSQRLYGLLVLLALVIPVPEDAMLSPSLITAFQVSKAKTLSRCNKLLGQVIEREIKDTHLLCPLIPKC